jgi:hypothetical protein
VKKLVQTGEDWRGDEAEMKNAEGLIGSDEGAAFARAAFCSAARLAGYKDGFMTGNLAPTAK